MSVGRQPNIENLGLENAGVILSKRGVHIGDDDTRTNIPHIYAVGDVSGRIALVNVGEIEGRHAVEKAFGAKPEALNYDNICTIMFLSPEVASVGLNEQQCVEKNIPVKVVKIDYFLPGCPPSAEVFWTFLTDLLEGRQPVLDYGLVHFD